MSEILKDARTPNEGFETPREVDDQPMPPEPGHALVWMVGVFGLMFAALIACFIAMQYGGWQPFPPAPRPS